VLIDHNKPVETNSDIDSWSVLNHSYINDPFTPFTDKIYFGRIRDHTLISNYLDMFEGNIAHDLAGDLKNEINIKESLKYIERFKQELSLHVSRFVQQPVNDLTFYQKDVNPDAVRTSPDIWLNEMMPHDHNPLHNHSGLLSFVLYVDVDQMIREEHMQQEGTVSSRGLIHFVSERSNESIKFNPKAGDILVFGSSHQHTVYPFKTNAKRISIAGNIYGINTGISK